MESLKAVFFGPDPQTQVYSAHPQPHVHTNFPVRRCENVTSLSAQIPVSWTVI